MLLSLLRFPGTASASPLQSSNPGAVVEARDSHGCYGYNHCSSFEPGKALAMAEQACKKLNVGLIPNGQTKGIWEYESTGFYVYVSFTSKKAGGWFVDTNFCNNVVGDIIEVCTNKEFDSTNGGSWNYDNQGVANVDTGPDKWSKGRRAATC